MGFWNVESASIFRLGPKSRSFVIFGRSPAFSTAYRNAYRTQKTFFTPEVLRQSEDSNHPSITTIVLMHIYENAILRTFFTGELWEAHSAWTSALRYASMQLLVNQQYSRMTHEL